MTIEQRGGARPPADEAEDLPALRATTPAERKRAFAILFVCLLSIGMGQSLFFAVLPPIARTLGISEFETTMIFSLSALLWVLTSAMWGRRSDYIGRKPVILVGLLGFAVSTLGFAVVVMFGMVGAVSLALMFPLLMGVRAIFGAFGSGTMPAAQAYVADRTTRAERAGGVAQIGAAFGLGTVVGPGFAAALAAWDILAPFFAVSALAFGSAFFIWLLLPERTEPRTKLSARSVHRLKLTDPRVMPFIAVGVLLSLGQSITMQLTAFYFMDTLLVADDEATQLVSVGLMAMALSTLFAQLGLIQRFDLSVQFLIRGGAGIMILAFGLLVYAGSYGVLVSALVLAGLGFGLLRPGLMAGASLAVSPEDQGAVAGIMGSTAATGHILNPAIGIPLYYLMPEAPFALGAVLMAVILLVALVHPAVRDITATVEEEEEHELHPH